MAEIKRAPRWAMFLLALVFLFETWVWDRLVAVVRCILDQIPWAEFRARARTQFNRWPAIVSVLAFGVPLLVVEAGCTISVVIMALGHLVIGAVLYAFLKLALLTLVALIFDLTKEKLMSLQWFVLLYKKLLALHHYAFRIVAPYREGAVRVLRKFCSKAGAHWRRLAEGAPIRLRETTCENKSLEPGFESVGPERSPRPPRERRENRN